MNAYSKIRRALGRGLLVLALWAGHQSLWAQSRFGEPVSQGVVQVQAQTSPPPTIVPSTIGPSGPPQGMIYESSPNMGSPNMGSPNMGVPGMSGQNMAMQPRPDMAYGYTNSFDPEATYGIFDNLQIQLGLDGAKGPEDLGISANMGGRAAIQTSFALVPEWGLGMQIGTSYNTHNTATRFLKLNTGVSDRQQSFSTIGFFQRDKATGLLWGIAWDYLWSQYYEKIDLSQWRGQVGLLVNPDNEIGFWGTLRDRGNQVSPLGDVINLQAINQFNLYWKHIWEGEIVTRGWVGLAEEHGQVILGLIPGEPARKLPFVFGADCYIPLSNSLAIFGEANFITPNDSGTVTAFFGVAWYPGGTARAQARNQFAPVLNLGNNPNFAVDAQR